jgi:hypothetical protein
MNVLLAFLALGNIIFSAAIIIFAFSLFLYLFANNFRNTVARAFSGLLAFLTIIYIGDVFLQRVETFADATVWLRFKWIGLAFIPAAYLHFSDALLRSTNAYSRRRRVAVALAYLTSGVFLLLVAFTDWMVQGGFFIPWQIAQFEAGPLFPLFSLFFFALTGWGFVNIRRARARCLTPTTRRRMTYLEIAFFAPALGVFPYLILTSFPATFSAPLVLLIALVTKIGIAVMITVMAYTVAYQGALSPDRVIKHNLIHYLLRGPLVATAVVGLMFFVSSSERWFGLTRETLWYAVIIGAIVTLELAINLAKPWIDRLLFWDDREDLERIQEIDRRLLTTSDLRQLLENIVSAACDLLQVQTGFVASLQGNEWRIETTVGAAPRAQQLLARTSPASLLPGNSNPSEYLARNGFWLWVLHAQSRDEVIGVLGIVARTTAPELTERERKMIAALVHQAELALEDRQLQQGVFAAFEQLTNEIELLQRARGKPRYVGTMATERVEDEQITTIDFHRAVKDALDHYWGGPKLTENPLLQLRIVQNSLDEYEGNPVRALRAQIARAIESLRPEGERSLTAPEWLLYNILELKVIQGMKVREIAMKLAMSESDLYRKQRIAIQELSRTLATMEEQSQEKEK